MNNIIVSDVGAEKDSITSLRAPTHFGRPNWDRVFPSIAEKHPDTDVGVFFCGPSVLSRTLHQASNKYSQPKGTRFFFGKGTLLHLRSIALDTDFHLQRISKLSCLLSAQYPTKSGLPLQCAVPCTYTLLNLLCRLLCGRNIGLFWRHRLLPFISAKC